MNPTIESLFNQYRQLTGDPAAAATLVLAHVQHQQQDHDKDSLTAEDVAKRLQVDVKTVRTYCAEGKLRHTRVGRQFRVRPEWLAEFEKNAMPQKRLSRHF